MSQVDPRGIKPPPPPLRAPQRRPFADRLWLNVDQAKRAWAVREAVRLHAGTGAGLEAVTETADRVLGYVETGGR